jgi:hypothetical protein
VKWLSRHGEEGLDSAAASFESISGTAKALILKTARAVNTKKPLDATELLRGAADAWEQGTSLLVRRYGA